MKSNYAPWEIKPELFPIKGEIKDQLEFLINFAVLAPSGHNSQPWIFKVSKKDIEIHINTSRSLEKSDPKKRQLLIGIGCSLENLIVAADYFGFKFHINYFPEKSNKNFVVQIKFDSLIQKKEDPCHLIFSINKRATNRNPYENKPIPQEVVDLLKKISSQDQEIQIINDIKKREEIADIVLKAEMEIMDRGYFRKELSEYVKSNYTNSKVGMPGFTQGIPGPLSFLANKLIKKINFSKKNYKKTNNLLKNQTPAFLVILSHSDTDIDKIKSGQILERIWLILEKNNFNLSPLAAPTQIDIYCQEIQRLINTNHKPQIVTRIGFSFKEVRHTPRLSAKEVIIK